MLLQDKKSPLKTPKMDSSRRLSGAEEVELDPPDDNTACDDKHAYVDENSEFLDTRFLEVCIDGDVEDLVQLLEEMARAGETLRPDILNCIDTSGRVSFCFVLLIQYIYFLSSACTQLEFSKGPFYYLHFFLDFLPKFADNHGI